MSLRPGSGFRVTAFFAVCLLAFTPASIAESLTRGAILANSCTPCHGTNGKGSGHIPRINDFSKKDMLELMQEFRSGTRDATVMDRHSKGYTDEEVGLIADYFLALKGGGRP